MGVNTSGYKDKPDEYIWGNSVHFNYDAVYDFDVYKLWAFLCAYYYDFSAENGDIKYWQFKSGTEDLLDEIFNAEYQFEHFYDNTSRWEELPDYVYFGGGSAETGTYYRCETAAYIYDGQPTDTDSNQRHILLNYRSISTAKGMFVLTQITGF